MFRFSLACLVLLTVCVYETEAQAPNITIWQGECRFGDTVLCRLKCKVVLPSGTLKTRDIFWVKEGSPPVALPPGKLNANEGVYTAIIPNELGWDVDGNYFCQYINPDDGTVTNSTDVITMTLPIPDPVTVTADVPTTTCVELGSCEISCLVDGVDFSKQKKRNEAVIKFYKADSNGTYQLLPKTVKIKKQRILVRWAKNDGGVDIAADFGQYKCEYDGIQSGPLTLAVTPVCRLPADPANGKITPKRKKNYINVGNTYTVKCAKDAVLTGDPVMNCTGANDAAGVLSPMATCDIPARSVTPASTTVSCTYGTPCELSCTIEGVIQVTRNGTLVTPTKRGKRIWTYEGNKISNRRSELDEKVMTYTIERPKDADAGVYKCGYNFGRSIADIEESGDITVTVGA